MQQLKEVSTSIFIMCILMIVYVVLLFGSVCFGGCVILILTICGLSCSKMGENLEKNSKELSKETVQWLRTYILLN